MGAPLPSRFIVIERVRVDRAKKVIREHIEHENENIIIRSLKQMSDPRSTYKCYLLEVQVDQLDTVLNESFWPHGIRVRLFRGNGKSWEDRDEDQNETESTEMENDSVNSSSEAEEAF